MNKVYKVGDKIQFKNIDSLNSELRGEIATITDVSNDEMQAIVDCDPSRFEWTIHEDDGRYFNKYTQPDTSSVDKFLMSLCTA